MHGSERFSRSPKIDAHVNVAKYGSSWFSSKEVGVLWDDPRNIYTLIIRFKSPPRELKEEDIKIQYWQCNWPKYGLETIGAGFSGWRPIDDLYNGKWRKAKFDLKINGSTWVFRFRPINEEFPEVKNLSHIKYRKTLKIRAVSSRELPEIESFETYTPSKWRIMEVSIEWGCGSDAEKTWDGHIEVFNGELAKLRPLNQNSKIKILSGKSWLSKIRGNETDGIKALVWYTHSKEPLSFDETIVTVRSKAFNFSFSMKDLEREKAIFIKDYDVLISKSSENLNLKDYRRKFASKGLSTIYDLIEKMPEQTLKRAWREMPPRRGESILF